MADKSNVQKVVDLINDAKIGMVATLDQGGSIVSRPLVVQQVETDGDMWFFTDRDTSQVTHVRSEPKVNISFSQRDSWVSVSGVATVVEDQAKAEELWNPMVEAWFPDGPQTPGLVFLRVEADSAEYWDSPGGVVGAAIQFVKAKAGQGKPDVGESGTVEL